MLAELRIRDLGVIDDAHLEVSTGLNVLTGETGAGKTMVVDALSLLLGERADPGAVRVGRPEALVEGRLQAEVGEAAAALAAAGVTAEDGEVVVARQVLAGGRSRAQLQGRMATVAAVAEVVVVDDGSTDATADEARAAGARVEPAPPPGPGAAGKAAALPGVLAAHTTLPVIGLPIFTPQLAGLDSLYSMVQMPSGVPVATVGLDAAANAGILAVQILAVADPRLRLQLQEFKDQLAEGLRL